MANEISIFADPNAGPVLTSGISDLAKSVVSGSMMRRIQTSTNGTFRRLIGGEQIGKAIRGEFHAIIVAMPAKVGRTFYAGKYDPDSKGTLPDCWSNDGVYPEATAPSVQARSCQACPNNVEGSGENGKGKACRFNRKIALQLEHDTEGHVYQLNVPAKSLFGKGSGNVHPFESYLKFLVANNTSPDYVVTKIAYDDEAQGMQMVFTPMRPITPAELELVKDAQRDPMTQRMTQISVGEADGIKPKQIDAVENVPAKKATKPKPQPEPEEEIEDAEIEEVPAEEPAEEVVENPPLASKAPWLDDDTDEDDAPEPAAKPAARGRPKKTQTAPMKTELADIVNDWLTDAAAENAEG